MQIKKETGVSVHPSLCGEHQDWERRGPAGLLRLQRLDSVKSKEKSSDFCPTGLKTETLRRRAASIGPVSITPTLPLHLERNQRFLSGLSSENTEKLLLCFHFILKSHLI